MFPRPLRAMPQPSIARRRRLQANLTLSQMRRPWPGSEKARFVAESFGPDGSRRLTARRHGAPRSPSSSFIFAQRILALARLPVLESTRIRERKTSHLSML